MAESSEPESKRRKVGDEDEVTVNEVTVKDVTVKDVTVDDDTVEDKVAAVARKRGFAVVDAKVFPADQERSQLKVRF